MEEKVNKKTKVEDLNDAIVVFVQIANLAQSKGILTFEDAVLTKQAIDLVMSLSSKNEKKDKIINE